MGYFGWTVQARGAPQFRHKGVVDVDEAFEAGREILDAWLACQDWPEAPPFSGGVLDSWPARLSDGIALCRREWAAVQAYLKSEREAQRG